jgi:1-deoxy-D-xylulose-5-phosphate reductoisomerase
MADPASGRRLAVLGSTGSIGTSTLSVVRQNPERLAVAVLAAYGSDASALALQIEEFDPVLVVVQDDACFTELRATFGRRVVQGSEALRDAVLLESVDVVVAAVVGAAGVPSVASALAAGKVVALANKEAMVTAGPSLLALSRKFGGQLVPIDSEHVALHQALRCGAQHEVERLVLTASGGPFLDRPRSSWQEIRPADALKHPTWEMGRKISVDSATLMNKALELIEARYLFDIPEGKIDVVVHPQSIVHSLVEFRDGSTIAQLSINDMEVPIQYALAYPERWPRAGERLSLAELGTLEFRQLDDDKFPSIRLARQALQAGESAPAVLNAANEAAVAAFLAGRIPFPAIHHCVEEVLSSHAAQAVATVEEALLWDDWGRRRAGEILARP